MGEVMHGAKADRSERFKETDDVTELEISGTML